MYLYFSSCLPLRLLQSCPGRWRRGVSSWLTSSTRSSSQAGCTRPCPTGPGTPQVCCHNVKMITNIPPSGWLAATGYYIDFAGSGVVHLLGACCSLVGCCLLGARTGRFSEEGKVRQMIRVYGVKLKEGQCICLNLVPRNWIIPL